jgi:hypothetical protein
VRRKEAAPGMGRRALQWDDDLVRDLPLHCKRQAVATPILGMRSLLNVVVNPAAILTLTELERQWRLRHDRDFGCWVAFVLLEWFDSF